MTPEEIKQNMMMDEAVASAELATPKIKSDEWEKRFDSLTEGIKELDYPVCCTEDDCNCSKINNRQSIKEIISSIIKEREEGNIARIDELVGKYILEEGEEMSDVYIGKLSALKDLKDILKQTK
jgi:hypothetical protein